MQSDWLIPEPLAPRVGAVMTAREGGVSAAPFNWLNLGSAAGDDQAAVRANRERFAAAIGATPVFLKQVHGARVVRLSAIDASPGAPVHEADASVTTEPGIACTVLVADCLPVLLAAPQGRAVAAAHAGWRGLSGGVVDAALKAVCEAGACAPDEVHAWLGACIGPRRFEVGADVLQAFGVDARSADPLRFAAAPAVNGVPKWLANLAQLARDRLARAGVVRVTGGRWCTVEDASRFFSFRRDRVTGRMAAAIWIER
jgi:polyphenol oxidase